MKRLMLVVVLVLGLSSAVDARRHIIKHNGWVIRAGDSSCDMLSVLGEPKYTDVIGQKKKYGSCLNITKYVYDFNGWRYTITVVGARIEYINKTRLVR